MENNKLDSINLESLLRSQLPGLQESDWELLLSHLLFNKTGRSDLEEIELLLKSITNDMDLIFRVLFNITSDDRNRPSHEYFIRAIMNLLAGQIINVNTFPAFRFLIQNLIKFHPNRYKSGILNIIKARHEKLFIIKVDKNYTCLHLMLDCYFSSPIIEIDEDIKNYLKTHIKIYTFYRAYLISYYLYVNNYDNVTEVFLTFDVDNNYFRQFQPLDLRLTLLRIEKYHLINFNWHWLYVNITKLGFLKFSNENALLSKELSEFIYSSTSIVLKNYKENYSALTQLEYILLHINSVLNDVSYGEEVNAFINKALLDMGSINQIPQDYRQFEPDMMKDEMLTSIFSSVDRTDILYKAEKTNRK